jgi:para-aminobenzoate synthetase component 1
MSSAEQQAQQFQVPAEPRAYAAFRARLAAWVAGHTYGLLLDSCQTTVDRYGAYELLAGVQQTAGPRAETLATLQQATAKGGQWWLGGLSYELKDRLEPNLGTTAPPTVEWPECAFFVPDVLLTLPRNSATLTLQAADPQAAWQAILATPLPADLPLSKPPAFQSNFTRPAYERCVEWLRACIYEGDVYEANLSQEFTAEVAERLAPAALYLRLTRFSPVPFAGLFCYGERLLICASPERFLQRQGLRLIAQPIKGTRPRGASTQADKQYRQALAQSEKDRAENVMIVDLVRNDLHRTSRTGGVDVPQLFEVQTFPTLHHLVSTVRSYLPEAARYGAPLAPLWPCFPVGSMTGAPKIRAMQLIAEAEQRARGIYAGNLGYITAGGNFDFNVVIRSLAYDRTLSRLSYHVGGAVTYDSAPVAEYEETLVKARALQRLFEAQP